MQQKQREPTPIEVLAIHATASDRYTLQAIFAQTNWRLQCVDSVATAKRLLRQRPVPVVLCAAELEDGTWQEVVQVVRAQPESGKTIVFTGSADEGYWQQILEGGADDILTKPFDASDLFEVVCLAYHSWCREHAALAATVQGAA